MKQSSDVKNNGARLRIQDMMEILMAGRANREQSTTSGDVNNTDEAVVQLVVILVKKKKEVDVLCNNQTVLEKQTHNLGVDMDTTPGPDFLLWLLCVYHIDFAPRCVFGEIFLSTCMCLFKQQLASKTLDYD